MYTRLDPAEGLEFEIPGRLDPAESLEFEISRLSSMVYGWKWGFDLS